MGTLIFVICAQAVLLICVIVRNLSLVVEKHEALDERDKAVEDLNKLKLLNKLKVDHEGNPINYNPLS